MTRIIVAGSGFAGVETVAGLARHGLCDRGECLWISPGKVMSFQPLIPLVASGRLRAEDIVFKLEGFARNMGAELLDDRVTRIERDKVVLEKNGALDYDFLVVAAGARPAFYGVPGADTYTIPLYSPSEAQSLYERLVKGEASSVAIVGAGFVGVELGAELLWLNKERELGVDVALVDMLSEPLQLLGNQAASKLARRILGDMGAILLMNHRVERVEPGKLVFSDGDSIEADIIVWSAGLQGPGIEAPREAIGKGGFLVVDEYLRVKGLSGRAYAVGDAATVRRNNCIALKMAREAISSARTAVANIAATISGGVLRSYKPMITSCFPLAGISLGPGDGILVIGKSIALRSNLAELYHRAVLKYYKKLLGMEPGTT